MVNVVIAGAEAPASALAHTLRELARRPTCQQRLHEEVTAAIGVSCAAEHPGKAGDLSGVLDQLDFHKAVVLEGLRLFAPATLVKRQALADTTVDGIAVPKGTVVELCVTAIHADPKQFERPLEFIPTRDGPMSAPLIGKERAYMPFSGGNRGCPGRPLALTLMRIALASIVERFQILPDDGDAASASDARKADETAARVRKFIVWPSAGVPVRLERRASFSNNSASSSCIIDGP